MSRTKRIGWGVLAIAAILLVPISAYAEVSVFGGGHLHVKATEAGIWSPVRQGISPESLLNPLGDLRGDLFGSWSRHPVTGMPEVAWSRRDGGQYDIVFSRWDGRRWLDPVVVTASPANDLRPFLYHDRNGSRYLLWTGYEASESTALLSVSGPEEPQFSAPRAMHVHEVDGRLPAGLVTEFSVLTVHEEVRAGGRYLQVLEYELYQPWQRGVPIDNPLDVGEVPVNDSPGQGSKLSDAPSPLGTDELHGGLGSRLVPNADAPAPQIPSDPRIHLEDGTLWVDWIASPELMGYAVYDGSSFGEPDYLELHGAAQIDAARKRIRARVTGHGPIRPGRP